MSSLAERLKQARVTAGLTQTRLGEKIKVSQNTIQKIEKGGDTKYVVKLAEALGVNVKWLQSGEGEMYENSTALSNTELVTTQHDGRHKHRIDYLDVRAAAGLTGFENSDYPEIVSSLFLSDEGLLQIIGRKSAAGIKIVNVPTDSMEPTIRKSDWVLLDTNIDYYNGDGIYAFAIDDALFIKRIQKLVGGGYRLHSDNKDYDPQDITDEICQTAKFIGRFIKTIHIDVVSL